MKDKANVSITDEIDAGNLGEAFERTLEFINRFEDFKERICQFSAQYNNSNKQDRLGIVSHDYLSQETNRIRFDLRKEVKEFRENILSQYFDIAHLPHPCVKTKAINLEKTKNLVLFSACRYPTSLVIRK